MKRINTILVTLALLCQFSAALSQPSKGKICGTVLNATTNDPAAFTKVSLHKDGKLITGAVTDVDGKYCLGNLDTGLYALQASLIGYVMHKTSDIRVVAGKVLTVNAKLESVQSDLSEVVVLEYKKGLVNHSNRRKTQVKVSNDVTKSAIRTSGAFTGFSGTSVAKNRSAPVAAPEEPAIGITIPRKDSKPAKPRYSGNNAEGFDREQYEHYAENDFAQVTDQPLSNFSIDVDNASYSNIRRFINAGQLPPPSAVRIEEMVNYFTYDYKQPEGEHPFGITAQLASCPWNAKNQLALIGLQGERISEEEMPPSNLVFLVDVSGSMSSAGKLQLLKPAFKLLTERLRPEDKVAIVTYAGRAGLVLPATSGSKKAQIMQAIDNLQSGGSTAGAAGIELAYKIAQDEFIEEGNNRVILATDGDFNVGVSSDGELVRLIEEKRETGVFLTTLGFGSGNYQDAKMEKLANKGNGSYFYIDGMKEAQKVFVEGLTGTLYTIAKDVKIQIEFNPAQVKSYRLIGYENRVLAAEDFNNDKKDAGELGAGHSVTALYEIVPASGGGVETASIDDLRYHIEPTPNALYNEELLTVKFRYKEPDGEVSKLLLKHLDKHEANRIERSNSLAFASAVAAFGMLLKESDYAKGITADMIISLAEKGKGHDLSGHKAEFIDMVKAYKKIAH